MKIGEQLEARLAHGHFSVAAVLGLVQEYLSAFKINFTPFQAELFALPHPSVEGHSERRQLAWTILKDRIHHPFLFVVLQPAHAGVVLAPCCDQPGCVALQATRDHRQLKRPAKGGLVAVLGGSGPVLMTRDPLVHYVRSEISRYQVSKVSLDEVQMGAGGPQAPGTVRGVPKNRSVYHSPEGLPFVTKIVWQLGSSPAFRLASLIEGDGIRLPAHLLTLLLAVSKIPDPPDTGAGFLLEHTTVLLFVALAGFHGVYIAQVTPQRTPAFLLRPRLSLSY